MDAAKADGGTQTGSDHAAQRVGRVAGAPFRSRAYEPAPQRTPPLARVAGRGPKIRALLLSILVMQLPSAIGGAECYLALVGPVPLHFAPTPRKDFAWPVPLVLTNVATNSIPFPSPVDSESTTNALILSARSPDPLPVAPVSQEFEPLPFAPPAAMPAPPATNSLSASNLLNVTPQMLAEYLKASIENSARFSTNGVNGPEVPFRPPLPWPKPAPSGPGRSRLQ